MKLVPALAALGAGLVACAVACSSFESGASDVPAEAGVDAPVAPAPPPPDDAGEAPDANPCRFGNGRFDGSFCDDFDRPSPLSALWVDLTNNTDGGVVAIVQTDAAVSAPNVFGAHLAPHAGIQFPYASAAVPVVGAKGLDCTFSINIVGLAADESAEIVHVQFTDGDAVRSLAISLSGSAKNGSYVERYQAPGDGGNDAAFDPTHVTFDPGWRRVHLVIRRGQPMTAAIDTVSSFSGSVPSDVTITTFTVGLWAAPSPGSGVTVVYDDMACAVE